MEGRLNELDDKKKLLKLKLVVNISTQVINLEDKPHQWIIFVLMVVGRGIESYLDENIEKGYFSNGRGYHKGLHFLKNHQSM